MQKNRNIRITGPILDLILLFLSVRIAIIVEQIYHGKIWGGLDPRSFDFHALLFIFIIWMILIQIIEYNVVYNRVSIWHIIKNTALVSFIGITTIISLDFLFKTDFFKRSIIIYIGFLSFISLLLRRIWTKSFLSFLHHDGLDMKNILIVGSQTMADRLICAFREHREYSLNIAAILDTDPERIGHIVAGMKVSGDVTQIKRKMRELKIDDVFFTIYPNTIHDIDTLFRYMDVVGINYHLILNEIAQEKFPKSQIIKPVITNYSGISLLSYYAIKPKTLKL